MSMRERIMKIEKLGAPLGAIVSDVDVRSVETPQWEELNALFCKHKVLVFPEQQLSPEDQIKFAERWGQLVRHPYAGMDAFPDIIELSNRGKRKDINQHWHTDMSFNKSPPKLTMLYALEAPSIGGDTAFANQALAYNELSDGMKATLAEMKSVHSAEGLAGVYGEKAEDAPRAEHPVVRTHDETGEKALYVCRSFTQKFVGWTRKESEGLLETLYQHSVRPEFQARQRWHKGDLVMWDNRCLLHFAVHDHDDDSRLIHRLQVVGSTPE